MLTVAKLRFEMQDILKLAGFIICCCKGRIPNTLRIMSDQYDVIIVGAGPAGLTAGYILTKKSNERIAILEAHPTLVGGISRTERYKDYLFDIGGHRFFSKSQEIENLWREILPDDFIERPRKSRIYYNGKFYSYPLRAFEALRNLGIWESFVCVLSYVKARIFPITSPRTFREWVSNQFGARLFNIFFKTYTEKVWGISCDEISADWAAQRIKGLNLAIAVWRAVMKSLGISNRRGGKKVVKTLIESFRYPRRGPGMLWDAAAKRTVAQGGEILMAHEARRFVYDAGADLWTVKGIDAAGKEFNFTARHVISSAPLRDVMQAIVPLPGSATAARELKYRDFITVAIMLNHAPEFDDNWIYIHDPSVKVGRVQNFSSWSPDMVPNDHSGCLGLEYFCFENDGIWATPDSALIDLAKNELEKLGFAKREHMTDGVVVRQKKAYPVYDDHYKAVVETIRRDLEQNYPGFHPVGRNGMHKYNNQDHAMMTGVLTAENIMAGVEKFNVWNVNEDAEYHEEVGPDRSAALNSLREVPERVQN